MKSFQFRQNTLIPWIITLGMGAYVYALSYHAKTRPAIDPVYDFYDTAVVKVNIRHSEELHDVYGMYNNIIEGQKQIVKAVAYLSGKYRVVFRVNSPRPATVFVDDQAIEVFLVPGDTTLTISMMVNPTTYLVDSLEFRGKTSSICRYYLDKRSYFGDSHIRAKRNALNSEDFETFCASLDSTAATELDYLRARDEEVALPEWFVDFEESEIRYQKAYLKLSNAYNRDVPAHLLDRIPVNSEAAVFSYYYYLYLKTYLTGQDSVQADVDLLRPEARYEQLTERHLAAADSLLKGEMHDVYITRVIFANLKRQNEAFTTRLVNTYSDRFNKKKYERFLKYQLRRNLPPT